MTKRPAPRKSAKSQVATLAAAVHAFPGKPKGSDFLSSLQAVAGARLESALKSNKELRTFLEAVAEASPFLRELMREDPARLAAILSSDPAAEVDAICASAASVWRTSSTETALMAALRKRRSEIALVVALADLGGVWDVAATTGTLSRFAECAISSAVSFLLRGEHDAGAIKLPDPENPQRGSGWILLGMGKLGAGELNYSSDIDLIVLFDPEIAPLAHDAERARFFVRLTQRLVKILQDRTEDGYVFRTDLRLRPDPGSTAIAISTAAALQYYESQGQNWERAALIKARPVAGDIAAGEKFLAALVPYIWRKYLDYAAIADIHSIKRQIHDHRGHGEIAVAGHNIKLGRGGIREIEFFVQTQQLIAGGRHPELRGRSTVAVLAELARGGWIDATTRDEMTSAYELLRKVEHRLQMIADEQTHTLPEDEAKLATIAHLSGFATSAAFGKALLPTLETVRRHYAGLFEAAPALSTQTGSLVFTGDADDPDTLETLSRLGYPRPSEITRTVRAWHFGRYPSMRSAAARERLTEITPALLEAMAGTDNAEAAFLAFDRFLGRLPAGVQLFSLLHSNPGLLNLLATILGAAPSLAETVIARPHVLDALLEPAFFGRLPDRKTLADRLTVSLEEARDYEDALDRARIVGQEQRFLIGVRVIAGAVNAPRAAGISFTDLAEVLIDELLNRSRREFERQHGKMPGGEIALLALGRLGAREMTAASDLDMILLYDFDAKATSSDGPRPLPSSQYYARLTQRLVAALSAPTAEGTLYEVDFRLRPSGNSGPLATSLDAFASYQEKDAWTWEHMALTRARPIAGDQRLCAKAAAEMRKILSKKRDHAPIADDVRSMRTTVEEEKGGDAWDLKLAKGGLLDIEFVAQFLQLAYGAAHPKILSIETESALVAANEAGVLPAADADILLPALRLFQSLTQVIRLCLDSPLDPATAPKGLLDLLAKAGELPDFPTLDAHVRDTETKVRQSFERVVGLVQTKKERK